MQANMAVLDRTLDSIKNNPDGWNQMSWASCFGGQALQSFGYTVETAEATNLYGGTVKVEKWIDPEGVFMDIRAQEIAFEALLGLELQAEVYYGLFCAENTIADLERMLEDRRQGIGPMATYGRWITLEELYGPVLYPPTPGEVEEEDPYSMETDNSPIADGSPSAAPTEEPSPGWVDQLVLDVLAEAELIKAAAESDQALEAVAEERADNLLVGVW